MFYCLVLQLQGAQRDFELLDVEAGLGFLLLHHGAKTGQLANSLDLLAQQLLAPEIAFQISSNGTNNK